MTSRMSFVEKGDREQFLRKLPNEWLYKTNLSVTNYGAVPTTWEEHLAGMDSLVHENKTNDGGRYGDTFPYIQYHPEQFRKQVFPLLTNVNSFIDVGCGAGDKLKIVRNKFPRINVYGVEHTPAMATWAGAYGTVFCIDAFKLDYINYDVIYAYWPIAKYELMKKLAKHIISTKRLSARFILVGFPELVEGMTRGQHHYSVQYA